MSGNLCRCAAYANIARTTREWALLRKLTLGNHGPRACSDTPVNPLRYERASDALGVIVLLSQASTGAFFADGTNLVDHLKLAKRQPDLPLDMARLPMTISSGSRTGAYASARRSAPPTSPCPARAGDQRELAILGTSPTCIATNPSDIAVALAALDALVHTLGPAGERTIPLTDFHRLPGDEPERDTVLAHGELITAVDLPPLDFAGRWRYDKVRDGVSDALALVSVAAALDVADGAVRDARMALGGVAPRPWRAWKAEAKLRGALATEEAFRQAAESELADAQPLAGNAFKVQLARNLIVRTLLDLLGESPDEARP